jgi:hypothetical protein
MATGLVNPFGPSGPDGDALLASTQTNGEHRAKGSTSSVEAKVSRDIYDLPAGHVALAMGAEARREKFDDTFGAGIQYRRYPWRGRRSEFQDSEPLGRSAVRRTQCAHRPQRRSAARSPIRSLQRLRQHGKPEGRGPLATDALDPVPFVVGHRFSRADAVRPLHAALTWLHGSHTFGPAALSGHWPAARIAT